MQDRGAGDVSVATGGRGDLVGGEGGGVGMWLGGLGEVPGEDFAGGVAAEEDCVVGGEGDGCDRAALGGWEGGLVGASAGEKGVPFVPTPMTCLRFCLKSKTRTRPFEVPIATTPED